MIDIGQLVTDPAYGAQAALQALAEGWAIGFAALALTLVYRHRARD